ncbi:uncharacterized protein LOC110036708 [Phalaenopsis equestris]|uniref:uncharacterized protein LOC110036708 n=1 Tax=Phalaenopsis equestris TaxID=78828 RepID=UPI0009E63234|nr:uncharacterized protein LOC110036708 [Phalaenopsis equestris]
MLKLEIEEHGLKCSSEMENIEEESEAKEEQLKLMDREAQELLMESEEKLKRTLIECTEETQLCAQELYSLIDSVSQYKEFMGSTVVGIGEEIREIVEGVKQAFEASSRMHGKSFLFGLRA